MVAHKGRSRSRASKGHSSRRQPAARKPGRGRPASALRIAGRVLAVLAFATGYGFSLWLLALDDVVVARFEGGRFAVPSKVFAAPTVLYPGLDWQRIELRGWLERLGYRERPGAGELAPGHFDWRPSELRVHLRAFEHPLRPEPGRNLVIRLGAGVIREIVDRDSGEPVDVVVLEPEPVSAFYGSDREQRDLVTLADVPPHLVQAILAVEDRRFEEHHGVDPRRVVGALLANLRAGRVTQGASTLTQQLVKNFFLTPERTFSRKAKEAAMALIVEARYDKQAILEAYMNEIYLGQRGATAVHGVGEAARLYFGKSASELSLSESALIAAIIQSPNGISPHRHPERARARRDLVLALMHAQGFIDDADLAAAKADALQVAVVTPESGETRYFLDMLSRQLPEVYDDRVLASEGLRIYSTLDPRMQRAASRALVAGLERLEALTGVAGSGPPLQGCILALRPQTGEVLALVGGRSYGASQFNRCTQARRQVGSVFKPFVYVAALAPANGPVITLASRLDDSPVEIPTRAGPWRPENYDREFRGPVGVREAVERSLNVPAARLGQQVGIERVAAMAQALGVTSPLPRVPSLALGTAEMSPLEVARAYSTLANGGRRSTPRSFVDVVQARGLAHEHNPLVGPVRAVDPATAYLAISLLQGVVDRGTAEQVRKQGLSGPIAGKTGTTDDEYDLWFVGFTPELVAVVWVGYDEPRAVGVPSSQGALPIWTSFMRDVVGSSVRGAFPRPGEIEEIEIDPESGALALRGCERSQKEIFIRGTAPESTCPSDVASGADERRPGLFRRTFGGLFRD